MKQVKKVSFIIEEQYYNNLKEQAERECISVSSIIRRLIIKNGEKYNE